MRPVLVPGNAVEASFSARTEGQLAQATVEMVHSRAPLLGEALPAAAIDWACALTATVLPEGQPYARLYDALDGLLRAVEAAPAASKWGAALVRFELLLLAELGFGLQLDRCAVSGDDHDLIAVSPRSGQAVGSEAAAPYLGKLLPLPAFVREGGQAGWSDILDGLALSGHFLMRDLITDRAAPVAAARERLIERLRRAAGLA
jgi:DNA repair protein RecO (recombination protein O)